MAEEGEDDGDLPIIKFDAVSKDEATANTGDENDADREAVEGQEQGPHNPAEEGQRAQAIYASRA
jgi:hypothetical protein